MGLGDLFNEIGNAVKNEAGNVGNAVSGAVNQGASAASKFLFPPKQTVNNAGGAPSTPSKSTTAPQNSVDLNRSRGEPATGAVGAPNQTGVPNPPTGVAGLAGTDYVAQGQGIAGKAGQDVGTTILNMPTTAPGEFQNTEPVGPNNRGGGSSAPAGGDSTNNAGGYPEVPSMPTDYNGLSSVAGNDPAYNGGGEVPSGGDQQTAKAQPNFWDNLLGIVGMLGKGVGTVLGNTGLIYMGQPSISQVKAGYQQQQTLQQRDIENQQLLQKHSLDWDAQRTQINKQLQLDLQNIQNTFNKDQNEQNRQLSRQIAMQQYDVAMRQVDTQQMYEAQMIAASKGYQYNYNSRKGQ